MDNQVVVEIDLLNGKGRITVLVERIMRFSVYDSEHALQQVLDKGIQDGLIVEGSYYFTYPEIVLLTTEAILELLDENNFRSYITGTELENAIRKLQQNLTLVENADFTTSIRLK